jgi:uncharacterized protein with HEPN domain
MKNNSDTKILEHILICCNKIYDFAFKCDNLYEELLDNVLLKDGFYLNIQEIGELTNKLSEEFKNQNKDKISFRKIVTLRNRIAHNYLSINLKLICDIVKLDIPKLIDFCKENINKNQSLTDKISALEPKSPKFKL